MAVVVPVVVRAMATHPQARRLRAARLGVGGVLVGKLGEVKNGGHGQNEPLLTI